MTLLTWSPYKVQTLFIWKLEHSKYIITKRTKCFIKGLTVKQSKQGNLLEKKKKITVIKVDFPQRKSFKTSLLDLPLVPVIKTTSDCPSLSRDHDSSGCPPATRIHRLL